MLGSVFAKSLRDRRASLSWWAVGLLAYLLVLAVSYPTVADQREQLEALVDSYPEAMLAALGVDPGQELFSPAGFVSSQATALFVPLALVILAVAMGAKAIAGEEEDNTIDLLLANPISRTRVFSEKLGAMVAAQAWLAVSVFVGIWLGRFFEMQIPIAHVLGATVAVWLLALVFGSLALAIGGMSGRRGLTLGVASFLVAVSLVADTVGQVLSDMAWIRRLSPFYYYDASQPLANGYDWTHGLVLVAIVVLAGAAGAWGFNRRDIGV